MAAVEAQRNEVQAKLVEALAASDAMQADFSSAAAAARDAEARTTSCIWLQQMKQAEFDMSRFSSAKAARGGATALSPAHTLVATNSLFDVTFV